MEGKQVVEGVVVAAPGNVAAPEVGAEMPVISKERWEDLQRWRAEGQTVSQMARVTGLDRKTVRSCLRKTQWLPYRRPRWPKPCCRRTGRGWRNGHQK